MHAPYQVESIIADFSGKLRLVIKMFEKYASLLLALIISGTLIYLLAAKVYPSITNKR